MENTEKKLYPSQVNSRTISARVPVQDYVSFLQEAMKDNISLNDWLLIKIYSKNNQLAGGGLIDNITVSFDDVYGNEPLTNLETVKGFFEDDLKKQNDLFTINKEMLFDLINDFTNVMADLHRYQAKEKNRQASIIDVKSQLTILMKNKFKNSKDLDSYRKDLYELLEELK